MPHCSVAKFHFQLETAEMADTLFNGRGGEMSLFEYIVTQNNSGTFSQMLWYSIFFMHT